MTVHWRDSLASSGTSSGAGTRALTGAVSCQVEGGHLARPSDESAKPRGGRLGCRIFQAGHRAGNRSPADPRTLIRAARDFAVERPEFALAAGMTALRGIANGWGYDITGIDVLDAYAAVMAAAGAAGVDEAVVNEDVRAIIAASRGGGGLVGRVLARQLEQ